MMILRHPPRRRAIAGKEGRYDRGVLGVRFLHRSDRLQRALSEQVGLAD
jgi:hypothetical protein